MLKIKAFKLQMETHLQKRLLNSNVSEDGSVTVVVSDAYYVQINKDYTMLVHVDKHKGNIKIYRDCDNFKGDVFLENSG
jgi:hypothetical protein